MARSRLCWIGAAAIESIVDGQLLPRKSRKQLFSRIDRELKQLLIGPAYEAPRHLLKELLYLVALSDGQGPRSREVRELHGWRRCRSPTTCWKRNRSACPAPASR